MEKELLTVSDFVDRYSISRTQLYREVTMQRLRLTKRGHRSMITRADAEAWLANLQTGELL